MPAEDLNERTIAVIRELLDYLESEWMGLNGMIVLLAIAVSVAT